MVFQESGLAGSNRWWEYRNRALHWAGYIALAVILAVLAMLWFTSYGNNKAYLAEVAAKVPGVERQGQSLTQLGNGDMFSLLPFLNSLLHLPDSQNFRWTIRRSPIAWDCSAAIRSATPAMPCTKSAERTAAAAGGATDRRHAAQR